MKANFFNSLHQMTRPALPPPASNALSQDEPDINVRVSDWGDRSGFDSDLDGDAESFLAHLDPLESDIWDEQSVPADSTGFHPLINGMLSIISIYNF
jgi:hypothetical protein